MRRAFKYKLYQSKRNRKLGQVLAVACEIYNWCIDQHKKYYAETNSYLQLNDIQKQLTIQRRDTAAWQRVGSQACQDITERIHKGYQKFFKKENKRPPTYKKEKKYKSITLKQAGYKIFDNNNSVRLDDQIYRYHKSREISGIIKTVTIKRDSIGDYYIIFSTMDHAPIRSTSKLTGNAAGFDFGCMTFLVASNGTRHEAPLPLIRNLKEVKRLCRKIHRCVDGSQNQQRLNLRLARLYRAVANQRHDWHHKLVNQLLLTYDLLVFETLNMNWMSRDHGKKVSDSGFSDFTDILEYKAEELGKQVKFVDRWFPSTKLCNVCGHKNNELRQRDRSWCCPACGAQHDRDLNAALNIFREGTSSLRSTLHTWPGPCGPGSVPCTVQFT